MKPKLLGKYLSVPVLFALLTVFLAPPAFAQVGGGGITGTVTDVTGGIMPGVEVTLRNEETNVVRRAVTNDNGSYRITNLPPGMYTIRFELEGFKRLESSGNEITVGEIVSLDATLEVGDITETLTVTSLSAVVNTEDSQPSTLIGEEQIVDLPLNGRNAYALALVAPGVVPAMGSVAQTSGAAGSSFMAAGTRARGNNFTLDGAHNTNDGISGLPVVQPSVDSVQEFRLIRNNFSAEYGTHSGSVVNVVTKSGTNSIHGTAYEFHRNDAFDAADTFAYYDETTGEKDKSPLKQNQFGFTLGGPIIKDKVFFFGGYEGFRQRTGSTAVTNVETPEFRQYLQQNYAGNVSTETLNQFPALAPTSGIMTVQDLIDTGSFLCWHCDPSQWPADLPVLGRVNTSGSDSNDSDQFHIRMDVNFTENTQLFGRFDYNDGAATYKFFARPGMGEFSEGEQRGLTLALTHAFTPTTLNEFRFSYLYGRSDFLAEQPQVPDVAMTGIAGISGTIGGFLGYPQLFTRDTFQFQDIVSFNVGDHFFRAGVDLRKAAEDSDFGNQSRPWVGYRGIFDYAMDAPYYVSAGIDPRTGNFASTPRNFASTEVGWFIQDDWKVSQRLTLNLGLRWDYFGPTTEGNNMLSNARFPTGSTYFERVQTMTVGPVDTLYEKDLNNFAPRFGFAYDVFGDNTTSLRGGYGVSYDKIFFNVGANSRFNPPFFGLAAASDIFFGDDLSTFPLVGNDPNDLFGGYIGLPYAEPLGFDEYGGVIGTPVSLRVVEPSIRDSYVHSLFLGIQRELPWEMMFEFNVQATYGKKLGFIGDPNRFNGDLLGWASPLGEDEGSTRLDRIHKSWQSFNLRQNRINSNYHGFNLQLQKRMTQGLSFQFAYTYGKSLDYNSDVFGGGGNFGGSDIFFIDPLNIAIEYGRSNFDVRQRFVSNFLYEIPFMRDQEGVLGKILGGWQINGIFPIQTGLPFGVIHSGRWAGADENGIPIGGDFNADGKTVERPNQPSYGNSLGSQPSTSKYIDGMMDASDFSKPQAGSIGNLGKNTFEGPNFWTVDMGLFKNFKLPLTEESRLQFRAEFFNLLNRVSLYLPTVNMDSSFFGQSTTQFSPREIQLALKLIW